MMLLYFFMCLFSLLISHYSSALLFTISIVFFAVSPLFYVDVLPHFSFIYFLLYFFISSIYFFCFVFILSFFIVLSHFSFVLKFISSLFGAFASKT